MELKNEKLRNAILATICAVGILANPISALANCDGNEIVAEYEIYVVQSGDNLTIIARKYGYKKDEEIEQAIKDMVTINKLADRNHIEIGQKLRVPKKKEINVEIKSGNQPQTEVNAPKLVRHKVKAGETLSELTTMYNTSPYLIMRLNGMDNPNYLMADYTYLVYKNVKNFGPNDAITVVNQGDTLFGIGHSYGIKDETAMKNANAELHPDPNKINPGELVFLPGIYKANEKTESKNEGQNNNQNNGTKNDEQVNNQIQGNYPIVINYDTRTTIESGIAYASINDNNDRIIPQNGDYNFGKGQDVKVIGQKGNYSLVVFADGFVGYVDYNLLSAVKSLYRVEISLTNSTIKVYKNAELIFNCDIIWGRLSDGSLYYTFGNINCNGTKGIDVTDELILIRALQQ